MHPISLNPQGNIVKLSMQTMISQIVDWCTESAISGQVCQITWGNLKKISSYHPKLGPYNNIAREYSNYCHVQAFTCLWRGARAINLHWLDLCAGYGTGNIMYIQTGINRPQGVSVPELSALPNGNRRDFITKLCCAVYQPPCIQGLDRRVFKSQRIGRPHGTANRLIAYSIYC